MTSHDDTCCIQLFCLLVDQFGQVISLGACHSNMHLTRYLGFLEMTGEASPDHSHRIIDLLLLCIIIWGHIHARPNVYHARLRDHMQEVYHVTLSAHIAGCPRAGVLGLIGVVYR